MNLISRVALFAVLILHVKTYNNFPSVINMSAPYKGYFSSAACEKRISKIGWPVVGVLFFSTSHQFIYLFFTTWWVL